MHVERVYMVKVYQHWICYGPTLTETLLQIKSILHLKLGPIKHRQFELLMHDWSKD